MIFYQPSTVVMVIRGFGNYAFWRLCAIQMYVLLTYNIEILV